MGPFCSLEEKQEVNLGTGYKNDIAQVRRETLSDATYFKSQIFSIQVDGTTDEGNMEE